MPCLIVVDQDEKTTRRQDDKTTRRQDDKTTRRQDEQNKIRESRKGLAGFCTAACHQTSGEFSNSQVVLHTKGRDLHRMVNGALQNRSASSRDDTSDES